ncbi:MAG: glycosyltransferase family 4 protein, partial [Candidatus Omnitrophica bacterium]|nr:glycosyltransferase family 4 protein [Candidatus Omnitrophota bacterium]
KEMKKIKNLISKLDLIIGKDLFFTGPIPNEQIGPAYAAANIFVNTSETEGICFSFLEAMCFGLPIVTFDVGGNKDVVENGKNGFLVKFGDINNFSKYIIMILTNENLKTNLNKNSYKILKNNFDLNNISKKLINLYYQFFL